METGQTLNPNAEKSYKQRSEGGSKGITSRFQSTSPAGLDCNGSLGAGNPIHPGNGGLDRKGTRRGDNPIHPVKVSTTALLIDGPTPLRLILNRRHNRDLRAKVAKLSRALPQAERLARSMPMRRRHISELYRLRVIQQGFEAMAIDGAWNSPAEMNKLFRCVITNSERVRRLRRILKDWRPHGPEAMP